MSVLQELRLAAVHAAAEQGVPSHEELSVTVRIVSGKKTIVHLLVVPGAVKAIKLSTKQRDIIQALVEQGPMKGDALAKAVGVANTTTLHSGHGIKQILAAGLILNDPEYGYDVTPSGEDALHSK